MLKFAGGVLRRGGGVETGKRLVMQAHGVEGGLLNKSKGLGAALHRTGEKVKGSLVRLIVACVSSKHR